MQNNRTHASAIAPDQQKKIKIHNIILENIKHRSRSNEHPNNKSNEDSKTKQNEADDYCIKPGLIKFIKANPSLCSCLYSSNEISRNMINAYDNCISSSMTGVFVGDWTNNIYKKDFVI